MRHRPRVRRREEGAAIVEATLILPLFLVLVFSLLDFGWTLFEFQTLAHRARTAARWGAVNPGSLAAVQNLVLYDQTTAPDGGGNGIFGLAPSMVTVTRAGNGTPADRLTVSITGFRYSLFTIGMAGTYTAKPIVVTIPVESP